MFIYCDSLGYTMGRLLTGCVPMQEINGSTLTTPMNRPASLKTYRLCDVVRDSGRLVYCIYVSVSIIWAAIDPLSSFLVKHFGFSVTGWERWPSALNEQLLPRWQTCFQHGL